MENESSKYEFEEFKFRGRTNSFAILRQYKRTIRIVIKTNLKPLFTVDYYRLYFDRNSLCIGIKPESERQPNSAKFIRTYTGSYFALGGFCKYFGLTKNYDVNKYEVTDDGIIVLYLTEVE